MDRHWPQLLPIGVVGQTNEYFAAVGDEAATAMLTMGTEPPTFTDELRPHKLDDLEALLTGRSAQEIATDPRFNARVADPVDEDGDLVGEFGVIAVTDTLTHALATADSATLAAAAAAGFGEFSVQGLANVARHAVQRGHRMYCFWYI
jgi:hypothetical protein